MKTLKEETKHWGIDVVRTELKEIDPPKDVQDTMNKVVKAERLDYLQVFEFHVKENHIEVEHRQEDPEYKKIHKIKKMESFLCLDKIKIFVIDDNDHSTMLLSDEY